MTLKNKINYIDLFAGIGGFHIALSNFNTNCVFASEWDKNCQDVYFENFNIDPMEILRRLMKKKYHHMIFYVLVFHVNHLVRQVIKEVLKKIMNLEEICFLLYEILLKKKNQKQYF